MNSQTQVRVVMLLRSQSGVKGQVPVVEKCARGGGGGHVDAAVNYRFTVIDVDSKC